MLKSSGILKHLSLFCFGLLLSQNPLAEEVLDLPRLRKAVTLGIASEGANNYVQISTKDANILIDNLAPKSITGIDSYDEAERQIARLNLALLGNVGYVSSITKLKNLWPEANEGLKTYILMALLIVGVPESDQLILKLDSNNVRLGKMMEHYSSYVPSEGILSLEKIRNGVCTYFSDTGGYFPKNLNRLIPRYLGRIPKIDTGHHKSSNQVKIYKKKTEIGDSGGWAYYPDDGGDVFIDCTHRDSNGKVWSSY